MLFNSKKPIRIDQKNIPVIESAISTQEHALNILTGSFPSRVERNISLDSTEAPAGLSTGIPSELLSYRPDIKTQELNFRRSVASINIAKPICTQYLILQHRVVLMLLRQVTGLAFRIFVRNGCRIINAAIITRKATKTQYEQAKSLPNRQNYNSSKV